MRESIVVFAIIFGVIVGAIVCASMSSKEAEARWAARLVESFNTPDQSNTVYVYEAGYMRCAVIPNKSVSCVRY